MKTREPILLGETSFGRSFKHFDERTMTHMQSRVVKTHDDYFRSLNLYSDLVSSLCDFDAEIVYRKKHGHVLMNNENMLISPISILVGYSTTNKLTSDNHSKLSYNA